MRKFWSQTIYPDKLYVVYMVVCQRYKHIYIGITADWRKRKSRYMIGKGCQFVMRHGFKEFLFIHKNIKGTREALRIENELTKRLSKMPDFCVSGGDIAKYAGVW